MDGSMPQFSMVTRFEIKKNQEHHSLYVKTNYFLHSKLQVRSIKTAQISVKS